MEIKKFGDSHASLFTLKNSTGMEVSVTNIGASLVNILVPDKNDKLVDVLLGYDSPQRYLGNDSCHGAIVGRYANRIAGASVTIAGVAYTLDKNEGENVLHGGTDPYYRRMWFGKADAVANSVSFYLNSPDGDQGMPGNAEIEVTYTLTDSCELEISYRAVSDKATYFNLTNHSYFNLDGHDAGEIFDQVLTLDCDRFAVIDEAFIPTGELRSVEGTPMDFRAGKPLGQDMFADYDQVKLGNGFDHNYCINDPGFEKPFATALSKKTGIKMDVFTDLPGVQFYSGNNMGTDYGEKDAAKYMLRGAFCLETQYYPDTPHHEDFPTNLFQAGEELNTKSVYKFSVVE